jgi:hypothetical protein
MNSNGGFPSCNSPPTAFLILSRTDLRSAASPFTTPTSALAASSSRGKPSSRSSQAHLHSSSFLAVLCFLFHQLFRVYQQGYEGKEQVALLQLPIAFIIHWVA